jgi:microcystin-dependent protein
MTSTLRRPLTFAAHERATIGDSKFSFTDSDHLGWLKCDGRLLSKTEYALLYTVIGDTFGVVGDQFRLPDSRGRVPGAIGRSEVNAANPTTYVKGDISGNQLHLLTIPEMPSHNHGVDEGLQTANNNRTTENGDHNHGITDPGHTHSYVNQPERVDLAVSLTTTDAADNVNETQTTGSSTTGITINNNGVHCHTMNAAGGDEYHNNMQPTIFMGNLFIFCGIYSKGIFPYTTGYGVF